MLNLLRQSSAVIAIAGISAAPLSVGFLLVTADTVEAQAAQPGGAGGDRGKSGSAAAASDDRAGRSGDRGGPPERRGASLDDPTGYGEIASVLGALNAANASQTGLENASPDSMPGKLYIYQQTGGLSAEGIAAYNDLNSDLTGLEELLTGDADGVIVEGDADYDVALDADGSGVLDADDVADLQDEIDKYDDAYAALAGLSDGSLSLTSDALDELNRLLGLAPDA